MAWDARFRNRAGMAGGRNAPETGMRWPTSLKTTDCDETTDSCAFQSRAEHLCGTFPEESISETVTCIMCRAEMVRLVGTQISLR